MKNKMEDLRNHLFAQLERLNDETKPPSKEELDRARAVSDVAKTLIESARVEVEFHKVRTNSTRADLRTIKSDFLDGANALPAPTPGLNGSLRNS
jgi:hypothetical protein